MGFAAKAQSKEIQRVPEEGNGVERLRVEGLVPTETPLVTLEDAVHALLKPVPPFWALSPPSA